MGFFVVAGAHIALLLAVLGLDRAAPVLAHWKPLTVSLLPGPTVRLQPVAALLPALPQRQMAGVPAAVRPAVPPASDAARPPQGAPVPAAQPAPLGDPVAELQPAAPPPAPAAAGTVPTTALPSPPAPPPRRQLALGAVQYRVLPPVEVPRAARRAGESGTVWLRVVVDVQGAPAQVTLHRSSGFARLDEQALWAMRQARFRPHTEDGRAVEVEVIAPIEYPAD
jgi:periplasmic protein TonB